MDNDTLVVSAIFITKNPDPSDPLGDREYLCVKLYGGLSTRADGVADLAAIDALVDEVTKRCKIALIKATKTPDITVTA